MHLLSRSPQKDCLSNGSNGQTKQDPAMQNHQLRMPVQAAQVSCHLHPPLWLRNTDPLADAEKRIQTFEAKTMRKLLCIFYSEHKANDWVWGKVNIRVGPQKSLRKLAWFRHVRHHDSLSKPILKGTLEGGRRFGRQRKCWMDNKEWTSQPMSELVTTAFCRKDWMKISAESSPMFPDDPVGQRTELN